MNGPMPFGYLQAEGRLTQAESARISEAWQRAFEGPTFRVPVLQGVRFVPFTQEHLPDAFCAHCGIANLTTSIWCAGCGAPLLRQ